MPKGPQGQKLPADVIGNAVRVMRIATGEIEETTKDREAMERGSKGGQARAAKLSRKRLHDIARKVAKTQLELSRYSQGSHE